MRTGVLPFASIVCALALVLSAPGCGSSPTSPSSSKQFPLPQSAIETAVKNFARGATNATNTGTLSYGYKGMQAPSLLEGTHFTVFPVALTSIQVNQPFSQRTNCQSGGYHETVGRITGTVNDTGISYLQMNATTSINGYRCMADGWVVNGDPYISASGSISVNNSRSSFDFNQSLGWLATNDSTGQKFSCQHSIHIIWDNLTGGHLTGNVTCTPPQTVFTMNLTF